MQVGDNVELNFDASRSNPIYGKSNTVQQEAIQYPYFIQIATGQETKADITNQLELNNPYTLFDCKYSETLLYNVSWLRSDGQFNSKSVYVTAYEALQVEQNAEIAEGATVELPSGTSYTKRGLSVKLSSEEYTDYDFVVNTSDETFRLPIKSNLAGSKLIKGNGMTLGLTNGTSNFGMVIYDSGTASNQKNYSESAYGVNIDNVSTVGNFTGLGKIGITTDSSKSGIELDETNLYLYYYIGETVQNANLINAGIIEEVITSINARPYIVETYQNGTSGYTVWSNGLCEQWGRIVDINSNPITVFLAKPYILDTYNILLTSVWNIVGASKDAQSSNMNTSSFQVFRQDKGSWFYWKTTGYIL